MEATPSVEMRSEVSRQTFIVVVKGCKPGGDKKTYETDVLELLKANGINELPSSISNLSCSFTIKLSKRVLNFRNQHV